jgi:hypothetical protein
MLNQFRSRLDLSILRHVNASLLRPLLEGLDPMLLPLGIMDSTDLPAAVNGFKKRKINHTLRAVPQWARARSKPVKADGSSATKNTASGCGCHSDPMRFYSFR